MWPTMDSKYRAAIVCCVMYKRLSNNHYDTQYFIHYFMIFLEVSLRLFHKVGVIETIIVQYKFFVENTNRLWGIIATISGADIGYYINPLW